MATLDRAELDAKREGNRGGTDTRKCWRCGISFNGHYRFHSDAPCPDCRWFLKNVDGDTTVWRGAPSTPSTSPTQALAA